MCIRDRECIDVFSAVKMFTANAARVGHEERIKGTLEPGKLADFIILNMDIFQINPEEISKVSVVPVSYTHLLKTFSNPSSSAMNAAVSPVP